MRESDPPRDIRPFVMYCVNGKPHSFLFIESTNSMNIMIIIIVNAHHSYSNVLFCMQFTFLKMRNMPQKSLFSL